ncbi:MAG: DUF1592 domain-containing protein [Planctomycetes bacterium]|nr:DUF1592 domain-containing protein [Planctomycetota bacterium]
MRRPLTAALLLAALAALVRAPAGHARPASAGAAFDRDVRPFLARHCAGCHGPDDPDGGLTLTGRGPDDLARDPATWRLVLERVRAGDMPPDDAPARPSALEVDHALAALEDALAPVLRARAEDPGRVTLRRLNRAEYRHTIFDLLGVVVAEGDLPEDEVGYGFDTVGDVLTTPPLLVERYLALAEQVAAAAVRDLAPVRARVPASECEREGRARPLRDGFTLLVTNGALVAPVTVPAAGDYAVRVRAYGQQAGPDPARLVVRLGRRQVAAHDVRAVADAPEVYEATVSFPAAGRHLVSAAFVNDYWQPDAPDPAQRDRNLALEWVEVEGPARPLEPTRLQRALVPRRPAAPDDVAPAARAALRAFLPAAFRRPVDDAEVEAYALLARDVAADGTFEQGLRAGLQAALVSPHFLYKVEVDPDPASPAPHPVTEHELAVRLAYYLWSGPPDERLRALADAGRLRAGLAGEVDRLLDDPRAGRFVEQFVGQWLQLRRLADASPDPDRFPWDEGLREAMRLESELLFEAVLREGRGALDLLDAPFTFVDERLARHYGLDGVAGPRLRRVAAPPGRGGLLGHAGVLTVTSNPTRTSPVKRGKWVLEVLLDDPPPPPLPGMDSLDEAHDAARPLTLRERLERHRQDPACARCHLRMDPLGFGLERFDAVGRWRDDDEGLPLDDRATLGAATFEGLPGLQAHLRGRGRDVVRALAGKLLVFALGRGPAPGDDAALDDLVERTGPVWRLRDLVAGIVDTPAFQRRRGGER